MLNLQLLSSISFRGSIIGTSHIYLWLHPHHVHTFHFLHLWCLVTILKFHHLWRLSIMVTMLGVCICLRQISLMKKGRSQCRWRTLWIQMLKQTLMNSWIRVFWLTSVYLTRMITVTCMTRYKKLIVFATKFFCCFCVNDVIWQMY